MQNLRYMIRLVIMGCLISLTSQVFAQSSSFNGKKGSLADSQPIYTAAELTRIGHDPAFPLDGIYSLEDTLDFNEIVFSGIGTEQNPFIGSLDGQGHAITGFSIKSDRNYTGLFTVLGKGATVQNLTIQAGDIQGKAYTGALAGYNQGMIKNCCVQGHIAGTYDVGGLVGINGKHGQIYTSQVIGVVKGSRYEIGGLVGCNLGHIANSRTSIQVTGVSVVGGLVGMNDETGRIEHCLARGNINGRYFVGGLVGHNWFKGIINHCVSQVNVTGEEYVGGLAGANYADAQIIKSSSSSQVQGIHYVGKVVGGNRGYVGYGLSIQDKWNDRLSKSL